MLCVYCRADISPEAKYCPRCGQPLRNRMGSPAMSDKMYDTVKSLLAQQLPEDHPKRRFPKAYSILEKEYLAYKERTQGFIDRKTLPENFSIISFDEYVNKKSSQVKKEEWEEFLQTGEEVWYKRRWKAERTSIQNEIRRLDEQLDKTENKQMRNVLSEKILRNNWIK